MKQKLLLKTMLLLFALIAGSSSVWANSNVSTVTTKFSATGNVTDKFTQTGDFTSAAWNLAVTWKDDASWQNLDGTKGSQIGSGTHPATSIVLTGSSIPGTITSVVVNTSGASNISATVAVSVGGTEFKCGGNATASLTSSAADYTFTGSGTGNVVITWTNSSSKAIYIKSITTTYSTGSASDPSITLASNFVNVAEAEGNGTIAVTYNNIATVDAEVLFYESNGTTSATYDWISASINGLNNVSYNYETNTGAARTAYMKVHQKNTEVYSGLISITQAAKTVAAPTFNPEGGSYVQGTAITLTSAGNSIYYNITTNGDDPATPTNASTEYTVPIALGSGTTKIKAIAYDAYGNKSGVTTRTYTGIASTSLPFNWAGGTKTDFEALTGVVGYSLGTYTDNDSNRPYLIQFNGTGDYIEIFTDEKPVKVTIGVKMIGGGTTSTITVQESTNGANFADVEQLTISGSQNSVLNLETSNGFTSTTRVVKLLFTKGSNVGVGPISVFSEDDIPVTITSATWASFSNASALDFTGTGVTAYIAKEKDASSVTLSEIAKVPASTGIVVNAPAGIYAIPVLTDAADATTGNLLKPWLTAGTPTAETYYTLAVSGSNPIFKKSSGGTLAAGKAYLDLSGASAPVLNINFGDGNTTSVNDVRSKMEEGRGEFYNLNGQRVAQPTKGLYIVNGKKVIIK
ncbi:MAG: chitobiase/beta-hexosaminidase C-terminal domain-containing protein [Prevotella sp.]|nr:chitobiase/beta-hexosaminidase C-terminal domain-containing protein [Prevotella sp.]